MIDTNDPTICSDCVGNEVFEEWIRRHGTLGACEIDPSHGRRLKVVSASELAKKVDELFREQYCVGTEERYFPEDSDNPDYRKLGDPYTEIMSEMLECDEAVVKAIDPHLPDATHGDIRDGAVPFYDDCEQYEKKADVAKRERDEEEEYYWYQNRISIQWQSFCEMVIYQRRFFEVTKYLDKFFGDPKHFESGTIRPIYKLPESTILFRARLLGGSFTKDRLMANPAKELGAPPKELAIAGRMNVEFIPVFYAAFAEKTVIAEVRPSIGDELVVGRFETRRPLRVFDFTVFSRSTDESYHDTVGHTRYDFIDQLEQEIRRPIRVTDKQRDFIPTQIVAEYIRERFSCEAIMYGSAVNKKTSVDTRNIALFRKESDYLDGNDAPLRFVDWALKDIEDVKYEVADQFSY